MKNLAVILLIVYFSNVICDDFEEHPRLPIPRFDDFGNVEWNVTPRIIGGTAAVEGEFKGKISIQQAAYYPNRISHFCGGVLIHETHVLTAAHCVTTNNGTVRNPDFFMLVGDLLNLSVFTAYRQARTATHVFSHPSYNIDYVLNDIAVIRVNQPFVATFTFAPVGRVLVAPATGLSCSVGGWGAIVVDGPVSPQLQRINATIIDTAVCNSPQSYNGLVKNGMLCAGTMEGGLDTCQGDSGGGLICGNDIVGIVSWGIGCARPQFPGVYTDVAFFNDWIEERIIWEGVHENIPTPTTIITDAPDDDGTPAPSSTTSQFISVSLLAACFSFSSSLQYLI